ncbi:MAG TPA: hypothetical protein VMS71_03100 [Candidatus Acidoferrum sp.]|nr:hypothetical protein [Candidatus Acidoferrum sp.]
MSNRFSTATSHLGTSMIATMIVATMLVFVPAIIRAQSMQSVSDQQVRGELKSFCDYNLNHFLLRALSKHRVVMLADAAHGSSVYLQGIIEFLNYWLDTLESGKGVASNIPCKLFLVLESDPTEIEKIKEYFTTGDLMGTVSIANLFASQFTASSLEFRHDLKDIWKRVETHNQDGSKPTRISFDIFGPEKVIDASHWSFLKEDSFFIYERDQYSSRQIDELLAGNPNWRALVFYGSAHLNRAEVPKHGHRLADKGYYLGHYLESKFGATDDLFTVAQWAGPRSEMYDLAGVPDSSYGLDLEEITDTLLTNHFRPIDADGIVVRYFTPPQECPLIDIRSQNILRLILDSSSTWTNKDNDFDRANLYTFMRYFHMIHGLPFDSLEMMSFGSALTAFRKLVDSLGSLKLDIVGEIETEAPVERLLDCMSHSSGRWANWYESEVARATHIDARFDSTKTPEIRAQEYRELLSKERRPILVTNLVNLLWVGTAEEQSQAKAVLRRETGLNMSSAKEWMVWYRRELLMAGNVSE